MEHGGFWLGPLGPVWLASSSPRRLELLRQIGIEPHLLPVAVEETPRPGEAAEELARRLALAKARAGRQLVTGRGGCVLGADTVVEVKGEPLGKPSGPAEAAAMLQRLAGREHMVITAVAVCNAATGACRSRVVCSRVRFVPLTPCQIRAYVATGEPLDKAGAYGIQGLGGALVERLEGSFGAVVGLPLAETVQLLLACGGDSTPGTMGPPGPDPSRG